MKKIYMIPRSRFVALDNESSLMSASTDAGGGNLNNVTIDTSTEGGGGDQLTHQQSIWDYWKD